MSFNTIIVKGDPIMKEYYANAAITPGHLVEEMSTAGYARKHATAGGTAQKAFAIEDYLQGHGIDDAYAAASRVQVGVFRTGDEVYALLYNGETAVVGSLLESQGDGTLRVCDTDTSAKTVALGSIVGKAREAVDLSGSSGADPSARILIEIM